MARIPWLPSRPIDPTYRYATSWALSPLALFLVRGLISVYVFTSVLFILIYDAVRGYPDASRHYFSYFTSLCLISLGFYFAFAALHSGSLWLTGRPLLSRWPAWLQVAHGMYYTSIVVFPILVTIVYWALIFSSLSGSYGAWRQTTQHALNSAFGLFEILVPRTAPPPIVYVAALIVVLGAYLGLAYLTHATEGFYVYSFLDISAKGSGTVAAYCVGIFVGCLILFAIVWGLLWLRMWVTETKMHRLGKFQTRRGDVGHAVLHKAASGEGEKALQGEGANGPSAV